MVPIVCSTRYHESTGVQAEPSGRCSCGTFAIGACPRCGTLVCGDHSVLLGGERLCVSDFSAQQTADQEASRAAARQAAEAKRRLDERPLYILAQFLEAMHGRGNPGIESFFTSNASLTKRDQRRLLNGDLTVFSKPQYRSVSADRRGWVIEANPSGHQVVLTIDGDFARTNAAGWLSGPNPDDGKLRLRLATQYQATLCVIAESHGVHLDQIATPARIPSVDDPLLWLAMVQLHTVATDDLKTERERAVAACGDWTGLLVRCVDVLSASEPVAKFTLDGHRLTRIEGWFISQLASALTVEGELRGIRRVQNMHNTETRRVDLLGPSGRNNPHGRGDQSWDLVLRVAEYFPETRESVRTEYAELHKWRGGQFSEWPSVDAALAIRRWGLTTRSF
jgi:hypothetical protein